jgi:hypothetical protein
MRRDCIQRVILNESDVPPGYVPLKSFGRRSNGESGSPEYELIHAAYRQRRINAVKHMRTPSDHSGLVFVDAKQADELMRQSGLRAAGTEGPTQKREAAQKVDPTRWAYFQGESACESLADIASGLGHVVTMLERLATAVESIATAPKQHEPAGAWRDMNGELMN